MFDIQPRCLASAHRWHLTLNQVRAAKALGIATCPECGLPAVVEGLPAAFETASGALVASRRAKQGEPAVELRLQDQLPLDACDTAYAWLRAHEAPQVAYDACERGDWLVWLHARWRTERRRVVEAVAACLRPALDLAPDDRPSSALRAIEGWVRSEVDVEDVARLAAAALDPVPHGATHPARAMAFAAALVVTDSDADAACAGAGAVATAAEAAAHAAWAGRIGPEAGADAERARAASLSRSAGLVRELLPEAPIPRPPATGAAARP